MHSIVSNLLKFYIFLIILHETKKIYKKASDINLNINWSINFGLIGKDHAVKNKIKIYTHIYTFKCSLYTCTYDFESYSYILLVCVSLYVGPCVNTTYHNLINYTCICKIDMN